MTRGMISGKYSLIDSIVSGSLRKIFIDKLKAVAVPKWLKCRHIKGLNNALYNYFGASRWACAKVKALYEAVQSTEIFVAV